MTRPKTRTRVRHSMLCSRRGQLIETIRLASTGQAHAVTVCTECDHDDMAERIKLAAGRRDDHGDDAA